jgi:outer membrane biosynthesis protein TonB
MPRVTEPRLLMRPGFAISVIGHVGLLALSLMFAGASPFDSAPAEAITVDIVSPNEIGIGAGEPEAAPERAPDATPGFEALAPQPPTSAPQPPTPPATPRPQPAQQQTRPNARNSKQAAASPQPAPTPTPPPTFQPMQVEPPQPPPIEPHEPTAAGMFGMPMTMPDGKLGGAFDAPALTKADIPGDNTAAFRNHLKTCSTLPGSVAPTDKSKIVLRVYLKPNGTLAAPPEAIEVGGASSTGRALFEGAIAALRKCQPYNMLPPDKYKEWKTLDLSFTPDDFTGG